jgi:hypothetical protein
MFSGGTGGVTLKERVMGLGDTAVCCSPLIGVTIGAEKEMIAS